MFRNYYLCSGDSTARLGLLNILPLELCLTSHLPPHQLLWLQEAPRTVLNLQTEDGSKRYTHSQTDLINQQYNTKTRHHVI